MHSKNIWKLALATSLCCVLFQGNLFADLKDFPATMKSIDASKSFTDDDGNSVQINADGSKLITKKDGTSVQINKDGSKVIKDSDGTTVKVDANGAKTIVKPDGSSVEVKPAPGKKLQD